MASISGINTKWWSNEPRSNWAIELSGFAQFNWSPTTQERRTRTPPSLQHMLSRLLNRKDARGGHSRQPSRQARRRRRRSEKRWSVKNLSAILWRIWARGDFAKSRISHESRNAHCRVHLQRAPSVRVSKPKCPKFRPFTKPKYLNEFLRTTALLGVRNV